MQKEHFQNSSSLSVGSSIIFHTVLLGGIYLVLLIICYPVLINADIATSGDEAYHFRQILEFLEGRFFLYYDNVNYHGVIEGLAAIPFFWFFGENFMAFKLPSIMFIGLFIWTSFLLAKLIQPALAWLWLLLLLAPSTVITNHILTLNYCNSVTFFLSNLILINFYKYKMGSTHPLLNISLMGYFCGLSIYVYAYSIIYLFPLLIIICLTHPKWEIVRSQFKLQTVTQVFKGLESNKAILIRLLDIVILLFFLAISFAYTFGGFGLDIAGVTILQINNLYKPILQLLFLILLRMVISKGKTNSSIFKKFSFIKNLPPEMKKEISYGSISFLLGLSPRLVSIFSGNISRGGQGLDMDFLPTKMATHAVTLFGATIPESLDISFPFQIPLKEGIIGQASFWYPALAFFILGLILISTFSFLKKHKFAILKLAKLQHLRFQPELFFILFPATMFAALIVTMNGPEIHYLAPLHWVAAFFVAYYLVQIKNKSYFILALVLVSWFTFYIVNNLNNYYSRGLMKGDQVVLKTNSTIEVIEFLKSKNLFWLYTNYGEVGSIFILSQGQIFPAENSASFRGKRWKAELASHKTFALLLSSSQEDKYLSFLKKSKTSYQVKHWENHTLFWDFKGPSAAINRLRSLND